MWTCLHFRKLLRQWSIWWFEKEKKKVSEKAANNCPSSKPMGLPLLDVPSPWIWGRKTGKEEVVISYVSPSYRNRSRPFLGSESCAWCGLPALTGAAFPIQLPLAVGVMCGMNKLEMCAHRGVLIGSKCKTSLRSLRCRSEWPLGKEWELLANMVKWAHTAWESKLLAYIQCWGDWNFVSWISNALRRIFLLRILHWLLDSSCCLFLKEVHFILFQEGKKSSGGQRSLQVHLFTSEVSWETG